MHHRLPVANCALNQYLSHPKSIDCMHTTRMQQYASSVALQSHQHNLHALEWSPNVDFVYMPTC